MENTALSPKIQYDDIVQVASTLAISAMHMDTDIVQNLISVSKNEKTTDDCISDVWVKNDILLEKKERIKS